MLHVCFKVVRVPVLLSLSLMVTEGHADQGMVLDGRVGEVDRLGNNAADEAADFGCKEGWWFCR